MLYGPNVLLAFIGAAGVLVIVLSILAIPHYRMDHEEDEGSLIVRLQRKLDQADLQITAAEYLKTSLFLALVLGVVAFVLTDAIAAALLGMLLGFFGYWAYLEDRREKRRREYQEALLEVINILQEGLRPCAVWKWHSPRSPSTRRKLPAGISSRSLLKCR